MTRTIREATPSEVEAILDSLTWATEWPEVLKDFLALHPEVKLPHNPSDRNIGQQMVAIFAANLGIGFNRSHLTSFGEALGRSTGDAIQWANKTEQVGIKLDKTSRKAPAYGFAELTFKDRFLKNRFDLTSTEGRAQSEVKNRLYLKELSEGPYERGHKDPTLPLSDDNLVMQPQEINRSYRDRYIFDDNGLPKAPNPFKLIEDPTAYYDSRAHIEALAKGLAEWLAANPEAAVPDAEGDESSEDGSDSEDS